jgi:hypothetical protein|nr:MAG TPA: hypothetical protein [Caudoviricetes sp.]
MITEINIIFTYNPKESERHQITTFLKDNHSFIFPTAYIRMYECYTPGICFADSFTKFLKERFTVYTDNIGIFTYFYDYIDSINLSSVQQLFYIIVNENTEKNTVDDILNKLKGLCKNKYKGIILSFEKIYQNKEYIKNPNKIYAQLEKE